MKTVRIAAAQTPEFRENVEAAVAYAVDVTIEAKSRNARLLCFPECYLQGYLLDQRAQQFAFDIASPEFLSLIARLPNVDMLVAMGMIERDKDGLFNTAVLIQNGEVIGRYRKTHLLKSESIFTAGTRVPVFAIDQLRFGMNICFDTNFPEAASPIALGGGSLIVCLANNMLPRRKAEEFRRIHNQVRGERCRESGMWLMSCDIAGERDGCISWGPTALINPAGQVISQLPLEEPGLLIVDMPIAKDVQAVSP
ncbi:carbon-nitrogen hydrolase family protein [Rhizobium oryziradicis]|uniref:Hydrolase n=1 Tax=Rhizobium oryziradicis TaxID=1867956 RepID=A0A1Q8ZVC8_9HYPH|nr:carbon-nitrogen hydrolase family protein [Rhizobium oryziradicis]OLP45889.1 hydrolase [Rhizobium oryziradicis]